MGVGDPEDLLEGIEAGIDMFDYVMPTRNATSSGFIPLTVPSVPTGIKIGVCILPCGVLITPPREFPQIASTSN